MKVRYMPPKRTLGTSRRSTIELMPGDRTLLSLDASLAIPTCVLRFEVSGSPWCTPIRLVLLTDQAGAPHRSDRSPLVRRWCSTSVFGLGFVARPRNPVVLWQTTVNPADLVWPPRQSPLMTWPPRLSRLDLGFETQSRNRTRLNLVILATMRPALDPASHWVPRTKPTWPHRSSKVLLIALRSWRD
jgi:hypothetical protein